MTTRYWHPFADMAAVNAGGELVIERGEGAHVFDSKGRRYLDATAGLWYCNVGFGRSEIADAAAEQMRRLAAYSNFGDFATEPTLELAERLGELAPTPGSVVFFTSGGSDAVDSAVKLVRRYWSAVGSPERETLVVREHAYHGMHVGGTALAGIEANRAGYGTLGPAVAQVAWDSPEALASRIDEIGPERVAAFLCEPVIGAGGVRPAPPGYLQAVRAICRERGVLFVSDEVITGFGRAGAWFASERFGLEPDLLLCAKGITSGYLPMGAVVVAPKVAEPFWTTPGALTWRHGYTYSGHASVAAAALANLRIMEREALTERALWLEGELAARLVPLEKHSLVSEVRAGTGVLAGIQLEPEALAEDPDLPTKAVRELRRLGVLTRVLAGGALQVSPALTVEEEDLDVLAGATFETLEVLS